MDARSPGQVAYEAYRAEAGGVSLVSGEELPEWAALVPDVRAAWEASADAVTTERHASWGAGTEYR